MTKMNKIKSVFILSVIGILFAGGVMLRGYLAPTTEPGIFSCVGFTILGYSPCPFGLAFFLLIAITSGLMLLNIFFQRWLLCATKIFSIGGIIFSGWVGWRELGLPLLIKGSYFWDTFSVATIPACVWGFLVFLAVGIIIIGVKPEPKI